MLNKSLNRNLIQNKIIKPNSPKYYNKYIYKTTNKNLLHHKKITEDLLRNKSERLNSNLLSKIHLRKTKTMLRSENTTNGYNFGGIYK
jgi:hypothetical protein